jgi:hypothetical protein
VDSTSTGRAKFAHVAQRMSTSLRTRTTGVRISRGLHSSARRLAWYGTCFGYRNNGSSNLSAQTKQALNCATLALDTGVAVCHIRVGLEFRSEPQAFPYPHDDWDCRYCVRSLDIKAEPQKRPLPFRMGRSQVRILSANASWL